MLWPRLLPLLRQHPDIGIELSVDYGLVNIVAQNFDVSVRIGDLVAKDMIAVRITQQSPMALVASPAYLAGSSAPLAPPHLTRHRCINLRLPTHGGLYAWDLEKDGAALRVRVTGQAIFNNTFLMLQAAVDGLGLAYVPLDLAESHLAAGRLLRCCRTGGHASPTITCFTPTGTRGRQPWRWSSRRCAAKARCDLPLPNVFDQVFQLGLNVVLAILEHLKFEDVCDKETITALALGRTD